MSSQRIIEVSPEDHGYWTAEPIKADDYSRELDSLLIELSPPLRTFVTDYAYHLGHDGGYAGVLSYAREIATRLAIATR